MHIVVKLFVVTALGVAIITAGVFRGRNLRSPAAAEGAGQAIVLAAGDIAECYRGSAARTAQLLESIPGTILALGDNAYPHGGEADYRRCYGPTWGRFRARTHPVPGNHEYEQRDAAPYFRYFGAAAGQIGKGYYDFELAGWRIIALNSNIDIKSESSQLDWLRRTLASSPRKCTLAFWHHPRFSSGRHGDSWLMHTLWRALYDARADVILGAHDHVYERFSRLDPDGRHDQTRGIRSFVVGTGGAELYPFQKRPRSGSEFRYNQRHGVLKLTLYTGSYRWQFLDTSGRVVDEGTDQCR